MDQVKALLNTSFVILPNKNQLLNFIRTNIKFPVILFLEFLQYTKRRHLKEVYEGVE